MSTQPPPYTPEYLEALAEERWRNIFCPGSSGVPTERESAINYALRSAARTLRERGPAVNLHQSDQK